MPGVTAVGAVLLMVTAIVYDLLLAAVRRRDHAYPSTKPTESRWWFGYARDVANAAATLGFWAALYLLGFAGPSALLGSFALSLLVYGLDYVVARLCHAPHPQWILGGALLVVCGAVVLYRPQVMHAMAAVVGALF
jgi:hypothetical protein